MGPTKPATKNQRVWMALAVEYGCIACHHEGNYRDAQYHHIVDCGKRLGHSYGIPLCMAHHTGSEPGRAESVCYRVIGPSVHRARRDFVARYGTELDLLAQVRAAVDYYSDLESDEIRALNDCT